MKTLKLSSGPCPAWPCPPPLPPLNHKLLLPIYTPVAQPSSASPSPCSLQLQTWPAGSLFWNRRPQSSRLAASSPMSSAKPPCGPWCCSSSSARGAVGTHPLPWSTYCTKSLPASPATEFTKAVALLSLLRCHLNAWHIMGTFKMSEQINQSWTFFSLRSIFF